jgi:16S rRNA (cytidine1402-2'-O)-methyltransferase
MFGKLYIVATPIGNREDMTERAKRILSEVDIVAAEDTRTTQKLFNMLGIQNKMVSNHKFNERRQSDFLISELMQGKNVAIVSDAGTPCISDPGYIIVKSAVDKGIDVVGVCGASSVITALSISGFSFISFAFFGFFPRENRNIREVLQKIRDSEISVSVFFESPKRIEKVLRLLVEELPDSELCLCNDLTKFYEKIYRGVPQCVLDEVSSNPSSEKGEYTLVIHTKTKPYIALINNTTDSNESMIIDHIVKNGGSIKDAIHALQEKYKGSISKKEFYVAALSLKEIMSDLLSKDYGDDHSGGES